MTDRGDCVEVGPFPAHASCVHPCMCCRMLAGDDMGKHGLKETALLLPLEVLPFMLTFAVAALEQINIR